MSVAPSFAGLLPSTADSARAVAHVYAASLSGLVPLAIAGITALALRDSQATTRAAAWRVAVVAVLVVCLGGLLPVHHVAWVVPAGLASPLIMLGRMQIGAPVAQQLTGESLSGEGESLAVRFLFVVYLIGVLVVLIPLAIAATRLALQTRRATPIRDLRLSRLVDDAKAAVGVRGRVRVMISAEAKVPLTWGMLRPTVLLPAALVGESDDRLWPILLHELNHVRAADAVFAVWSRLACAVLWFHPAAWWLDRQLRADCEVACDDRVLAAGVRQSDYAELLVDACDRLQRHRPPPLAVAMCQRAGLRQRLRSILDPSRDRRPASRLAGALSISLTIILAVPASMARLAPSRSVLNSLMHDQRWESRAYAVLGLAQRPDSIEVARSAASKDPDPKVRAWARYAVSLEPVAARAHRARPAP